MGESKRHKQKIKFKVLESHPGGDYERSPGYQCSSAVVLSTRSETLGSKHPLDCRDPPLDTMDSKYPLNNVESKYRGNYERDPDYLFSGGALIRSTTDSAPVPSKYRGNYERDPDYQCSSGGPRRSNTDALQSKYRGDYERDPSYMRWQLSREEAPTFDPTLPHRIPLPQEVLEGRGRGQFELKEGHGSGRSHVEEVEGRGSGRTDKYRGDYDRCETYTFPPSLQLPSSMSPSQGGSCDAASRSCDGVSRSCGTPIRMRIDDKCCGNYERDPLYMEKLNHLVPATHTYTTLEATTREAVQPYSSTITCHSSSPSKDGSISPEPQHHHSPVHSGMLSAEV